MPDKYFQQELTTPWYGLYSQPTEPSALNNNFQTLLHNAVLLRGLPSTRPGVVKVNGQLLGDGARTVYGMSTWRDTTAGDKLIIACGSLLQSIFPAGGDPTILTNSFPSSGYSSFTGARTVFAQLGGRLFVANGTDPNRKFNGTNVTRMGQGTPTSLSAPSTSSGSLNGTRNYKATLVSTAANGSFESEPTAATAVSYAAQKGTFSAPSVPATDPQVDRWNLYATVSGGATYYRVNTTPVSAASTIQDNLTDDLLQAGVQIDTLLDNSPPLGPFTLVAVHQGRLVGIYASEPNTLYWSDIGLDTAGIYPKPENWPPRNRLVFGDNGGTAITAIVSFFDWLVVFQNFGCWAIKDDINSDSKVIRPLLVGPDNRGTGVADITNIAISENKIVFAAKDGVYEITRVTDTRISYDLQINPLSNYISNLWQQVDFSQGGSSLWDRDNRRWVFFGKGKA